MWHPDGVRIIMGKPVWSTDVAPRWGAEGSWGMTFGVTDVAPRWGADINFVLGIIIDSVFKINLYLCAIN